MALFEDSPIRHYCSYPEGKHSEVIADLESGTIPKKVAISKIRVANHGYPRRVSSCGFLSIVVTMSDLNSHCGTSMSEPAYMGRTGGICLLLMTTRSFSPKRTASTTEMRMDENSAMRNTIHCAAASHKFAQDLAPSGRPALKIRPGRQGREQVRRSIIFCRTCTMMTTSSCM